MPAMKAPPAKELRKTGKGQRVDRAIPGNAGDKTATPAPEVKKGKSTKAHALPPIVRNTHRCRDHAFQDARYGPQMRVLNACKSKSSPIAHRCSVCGTVTDG